MKKSFILYNDQVELINELTDIQAGKLLRLLYQYSGSESHNTIKDPSVKMAFIAIKSQLDRDAQKYSKVCEKNKENISKRWNKKDTPVYDRIRPDTNHTDTDTDTDTDTEKDKDKNIARFNSDDFNKFYSEYPVHTGKTPALEKWKKKLKDGSLPGLNILIEAIGKQKEWRLNATDFRPAWKNPAAWLHQEAWTDELTEYGGNNGTGKQYDRKDKNWVDREADAETARLNARYRAIQASKAAPGDTG